MANLIKLYINKYYITYNLRKYMGCTPAAGKGFNKSQGFKQYKDLKEQARQSVPFNTILIFYTELFPLARNIIQKYSSFQDLLQQLDKFAEVVQDFKQIDVLAGLAQVLSILPHSVKPALESSRPILITMQEESLKFIDKQEPVFQDITPYFELLKAVENQKSKLVQPKIRFQHGKTVIRYGRKIAEDKFQKTDPIDQKSYKTLQSYIQAVNLIHKITKDIAKISELMDKNIPFVGKKVRDYLESGESNAVVDGTKNAINKISNTIEQNIKKVESFIKKIHLYKYPELNIQSVNFNVNVQKVGVKIDVIGSLPDWVNSQV